MFSGVKPHLTNFDQQMYECFGCQSTASGYGRQPHVRAGQPWQLWIKARARIQSPGSYSQCVQKIFSFLLFRVPLNSRVWQLVCQPAMMCLLW